jgi:histidinol dehydrogenase
MKLIKHPQREKWSKYLKRPESDQDNLEGVIGNILNEVRQNGDAALRYYTEKFDGFNLDDIQVTDSEINRAVENVDHDLKEAIEVAAANIEKFHKAQLIKYDKVETTEGVFCWQKQVPIQRVGLYAPGGTAPLFSSVLMLGIPAQIAGCQEVILCSPPNQNGQIHDSILYAAKVTGISKIYKVGGAQAIAAMAYGTKTVPGVDKIFGPGNSFVTAAKQLASLEGVAIDLPAGPSEVAIIADSEANPEFIAADLLSQAEHGNDSQVILISDDERIIAETQKSIDTQLPLLTRKKIAESALNKSRAFLVKDMQEALDITNDYAPEHLILAVKNPEKMAEQVENSGSVFLGYYTPEAAGDYASGTNHTLPTNGYARAYSGVTVDSFMKKISFQQITREGMTNLGRTIEILAEAEQLDAHKNAITLRLKELQK